MAVLGDRLVARRRAAKPQLVVGAAGLAVAPVDGLEGSVDRHGLIQARIAGVNPVLEHLLARNPIARDKHLVEFAGSSRLVPVERSAVGPREHLHILLGRAVTVTGIGTEVHPAIVVAFGVLVHAHAHDDLRASLQEIG